MTIIATEIVEVSNDYYSGYDVPYEVDEETGQEIPYTGGWIAGSGDITSEITGKTRELVLEKLGLKDGTVQVIESHRDGGYCVTCSFEYLVFELRVDGKTVYESDMDEFNSPFAALQDWLTA